VLWLWNSSFDDIDRFCLSVSLSRFLSLQTGIEPQFILFFDCPEEEMERRLLGRNQVWVLIPTGEGFRGFEMTNLICHIVKTTFQTELH